MVFRLVYAVLVLPACTFAALSPVFLSACTRKSSEEEIVLPVTSPLSRSVIGYGVVNANYTRILDQRGEEGKSIGFLRKGQIVEIQERRPVVIGETAEMWLLVSGDYTGWLKENELRVYPSKPQAITASESIIR
jgi:hypothetical protein